MQCFCDCLLSLSLTFSRFNLIVAYINTSFLLNGQILYHCMHIRRDLHLSPRTHRLPKGLWQLENISHQPDFCDQLTRAFTFPWSKSLFSPVAKNNIGQMYSPRPWYSVRGPWISSTSVRELNRNAASPASPRLADSEPACYKTPSDACAHQCLKNAALCDSFKRQQMILKSPNECFVFTK